MLAYGLPHRFIGRNTLAKRTAADYLLLSRRRLLQGDAGLSVQLAHGSLQHHIKVLPHKGRIQTRQLECGCYAERIQLFTDAAANPPDFLNRLQRKQLFRPAWIVSGQGQNATKLWPLFGCPPLTHRVLPPTQAGGEYGCACRGNDLSAALVLNVLLHYFQRCSTA